MVGDGRSYVYRVRNDADLDLGETDALHTARTRTIAGNSNADAKRRRAINQRSFDAIAAGPRDLEDGPRGAAPLPLLQAAYVPVDVIDRPGRFCRRDTGWRALLQSYAPHL